MAYHLVFSHFEEGSLSVTINPTIHIITVLVTSTTDLATEDTYLVTDTPAILNVAIVKTPNITRIVNVKFAPI
jgi:hypothetical protein